MALLSWQHAAAMRDSTLEVYGTSVLVNSVHKGEHHAAVGSKGLVQREKHQDAMASTAFEQLDEHHDAIKARASSKRSSRQALIESKSREQAGEHHVTSKRKVRTGEADEANGKEKRRSTSKDVHGRGNTRNAPPPHREIKDGMDKENTTIRVKGVSGNALKVFGVIASVILVVAVVVIIRSWNVQAAEEAEKDAAAEAKTEDSSSLRSTDRAEEAPQAKKEDDPKLKALKSERLKLVSQQAVAKEKLTKLLEEILRLEHEQQTGVALTDEELNRKVKDCLESSDIIAQRSLLSAVAYAAPFMTQGQKVYTTMEARLKEAQDRAQQLMKEETETMYSEITASLNLQGLSATELINDVQVPKLSLLLAASMAPMQLNAAHLANILNLVAMVIFVVAGAVVLCLDSTKGCWSEDNVLKPDMGFEERFKLWIHNMESNLVYGWTSIDFFLNSFFFLIRLRFYFLTKQLVEPITTPPPISVADNPVRAFRHLVDFHISCGGQALRALSEIQKSVLFQLASWTTIFNFCWMLFGADIIMNVPWSSCRIWSLVVLRGRVLFFFMLIIPMVLSIVFFLANLVFNSNGFAMQLLRAADFLDESSGLGAPVFKILAYSFLVRSVEDTVEIQIISHRHEKTRLDAEREALEKTLAQTQESLQRNSCDAQAADGKIQLLEDKRISCGGKSPEELEEQFRQMKEELLDKSESFFQSVNDRGRDLAASSADKLGEGAEVISEKLKKQAAAAAHAAEEARSQEAFLGPKRRTSETASHVGGAAGGGGSSNSSLPSGSAEP